MVVDDSAVVRGLISRALESDPAIKVEASASDGDMAVRLVTKHKIDVIVLDIEMPVMDGLTALPKLLAADPTLKIIMASTLTLANAEISMRALQLGAADYIPKPTTSRELTGAEDFKRELTEKVKALALRQQRERRPYNLTGQATTAPVPPPRPAAPLVLRDTTSVTAPAAIAIGSSTGGPQALFEVMRHLQGISQPVFITQHMPATFTTILAQHISRQCNVQCEEAREGEIVVPGRVYLAPGDKHMLLHRFGADVRVTLTQDPPENFCRPAVDPMLRSLAAVYGSQLLAVILTGMGSDGAKGVIEVDKAGGNVIAQDEASSVVWGMPGAAAATGVCRQLLPLNDIGEFLRQQAHRPAKVR